MNKTFTKHNLQSRLSNSNSKSKKDDNKINNGCPYKAENKNKNKNKNKKTLINRPTMGCPVSGKTLSSLELEKYIKCDGVDNECKCKCKHVEKMLHEKYYEYIKNGEITWDEFESDPEANKEKVVLIKNSDFIYGTLLFDVPCAIKFTEDIVFNPNNGNDTNEFYEPTKSDKAYRYTGSGFNLGFFAAIALTGKNIIIDLNNHSIKQFVGHYLYQRFYAHIELANQPFIGGQGPSDFGKIKASEKVLIMNGIMNLSSHHGIHGNLSSYIFIHNIKFFKFEVGGIAINGGHCIRVRKCLIDAKFYTIPVLGIFSSALFQRSFGASVIEATTQEDSKNDLTEKLAKLTKSIRDVYNDVVKSDGSIGRINPSRDSTRIYINHSGISDGVTYGLIFNKIGVAVNGFSATRPKIFAARNIKIENCKIRNLRTDMHEIIALTTDIEAIDADVGMIATAVAVHRDVAGAVYQILRNIGLDGLYKENVVSDMYFSYCRWSSKDLPGSDPALIQGLEDGLLGTLGYLPDTVAWARKDVDFTTVNDFLITSNTPWEQVLFQSGMTYIGNSDSMFHVSKGNIGIRIDSCKKVSIKNVKIIDLFDITPQGQPQAGPYSGPLDGGNFKQTIANIPGQDLFFGFTGNPIFGVLVTASEDIYFNKVVVLNLCSKHGSAYGIQIAGDTHNTIIKNSSISHIVQDSIVWGSLPNKAPMAAGLFIDYSCSKATLCNLNIDRIVSTNVPYLSHRYILDGTDIQLTHKCEDKCKCKCKC